jgi:serine/threonine protein kinase/Tfp pilus assembly protein PilF
MEPDDDKTSTHVVLSKGTMVSHYRIVEKIGAGGMGEVYLAEDTQLDRKVALKFLPPHLCQDEDCRKRFRREAQAAAKLSHPNIIHVYDVAEYQGRPFFAMEHVEGRPLRDVGSEELDLDRIVGIAIQLCDGLHSAHAAGVTHRDIKPSNIIIDSSGRPRLLDFGLATVKGGEHLTKTGSTLGTVGYMSPEQIEGKATDARSDLFSLGVVLYELIANKSPFRRDDDTATLKAILQDTPEPLARYKSDVPDDLQRIVSKLLEKDPSLRYQSATGVIPDLKKFAPSRTSGIVIEKKSNWWNRYVVPSAVVVLLIVLGFWYFGDRTAYTSSADERKMLAVLPFENLGGPEDESFADGITEEITSRLAKLSGLGVISRTSAMKYKNSEKTLRQIGEELGVEYILEGTVRYARADDAQRARINPQLIRVVDDTHVWTESYDHILDDIFGIQSEIAQKVADALDVSLLQSERATLADRPTENLDAYQAYLAAKRHDRDSMAVRMCELAIELDPEFALAYAELSITHSHMYQTLDDHTEGRLRKAKEAVDQALILQPNLPEAHLAMGYYHYWGFRDYDRALEEFEIARQGLPNDPQILMAVAYIWRRLNRFADAVDMMKEALRLDPQDNDIANIISGTYIWMHDYREALDYIDRAISIRPDVAGQRVRKSFIYLLKGDLVKARETLTAAPGSERYSISWALLEMHARNYEAALGHVKSLEFEYFLPSLSFWTIDQWKGALYNVLGQPEQAQIAYDSARIFLESHREEFGEYPGYHSSLGIVYAALGRKEDALREGRLAVDRYPFSRDAMAAITRRRELAYIYTAAGEYDAALDLLEQLIEPPSYMVTPATLHSSFVWDRLRDHPRFQALLDKYEIKHE